MTIQPGPVWGGGVVVGCTCGLRLENLQIEGGYDAIGCMALYSFYTTLLRDVSLKGTHAAYSSFQEMLNGENVTITPGRYGIVVMGSQMTIDHLTFKDPGLYKTEYYYRYLRCDYARGAYFTNVRDTGNSTRYPSIAAFSSQPPPFSNYSKGTITQDIRLCDVVLNQLGPNAVFVQLEGNNAALGVRGKVELQDCRYAGATPIASVISNPGAWWLVRVQENVNKGATPR